LLGAFNTRDIDAMVACSDPSVEVREALSESVGGGVYRGHDGLRRYHRDLEEAWDEVRVEPEVFFDLGERTLAFYVVHARGRQSGIEVAMPLAATVWTWRDGLIVGAAQYANRDDALHELGVSLDELEAIAP
jgi:ketosteroid isomerase-like protein